MEGFRNHGLGYHGQQRRGATSLQSWWPRGAKRPETNIAYDDRDHRTGDRRPEQKDVGVSAAIGLLRLTTGGGKTMERDKTKVIAALTDLARTAMGVASRLVPTQGISALPLETQSASREKVGQVSEFCRTTNRKGSTTSAPSSMRIHASSGRSATTTGRLRRGVVPRAVFNAIAGKWMPPSRRSRPCGRRAPAVPSPSSARHPLSRASNGTGPRTRCSIQRRMAAPSPLSSGALERAMRP